jgi:large subunit ribosomal protein L10
MDREQKTAVVEELASELKESTAIFAVDYRGISVPQAAELRAGLRDADTRFRIVKNRLTLRAADEAGTDELKDFLSGPTALALVKGDAALAAKTLNRLGSEWELLDYKGGLMDGEALDPDSFVAIARLPGRDALNAQLAGIVASPLTGLVRGLGSMIQGLALQLGQIAEQGLVTGEAQAETSAEEEEAPKDEEETPKEAEAPAGEADSDGSDEETAEAEDGSSDDGEADAPSAEEPAPDPEPAESPEESSEEQAPEGEDAGQGDAAETGEGDADIGEEPTEDSKDVEAPAGEAEDASSDQKEDAS